VFMQASRQPSTDSTSHEKYSRSDTSR
jgi:hypothetical protein